MKDAERIFVDTNVLLAATDRSRHTHQESVQFLEKGVTGEVRLFTCGQVLREYLVVATRPVDVNGLGIKADQAVKMWPFTEASSSFFPKRRKAI